MAAVENIHAQFFRQRVGPVPSLTGDKRIDTLFVRFLQFVSRSARDNANGPAEFRPAGNHFRLQAQYIREALLKFQPRDGCARLKSDMLPLLEEELLEL